MERWGNPLNIDAPWQAGMHLKYPYPIDSIRTFPTGRIHTVEIGFERKEKIDEVTGKEVHDPVPILWTQEHWKAEFPFLVAASEARAVDVESAEQSGGAGGSLYDLLVMALVVNYRIDDVGLYGYGVDRCYRDAEELIKVVCEREAMHFCATHDMESILGPGRYETGKYFRDIIKKKLDSYKLGIEVEFAGIESAHPPIEVAESFEKVVSALQQKQTLILNAQSAVQKLVLDAKGEGKVLISQAQAYKTEQIELAKAEALRFANQLQAYKKGADVYLWREYLSILDDRMPAIRKYIIASDNVDEWIYEFDLKEQLQPDLFSGLGMKKDKQETAK